MLLVLYRFGIGVGILYNVEDENGVGVKYKKLSSSAPAVNKKELIHVARLSIDGSASSRKVLLGTGALGGNIALEPLQFSLNIDNTKEL